MPLHLKITNSIENIKFIVHVILLYNLKFVILMITLIFNKNFKDHGTLAILK